MAEIFEIKSYQYFTFSSRNSGTKGVIKCKADGDREVNIHFLEGVASLPPAKKESDYQYMLYYPYSDMVNIVDMLRNESPVHLVYVPEGNNNVRLSTDKELVGEGEEK